jgi:hypothetical protein
VRSRKVPSMEYCVGGAEKPYHGIRSVRSRKAPSVEYYVGGAEKHQQGVLRVRSRKAPAWSTTCWELEGTSMAHCMCGAERRQHGARRERG